MVRAYIKRLLVTALIAGLQYTFPAHAEIKCMRGIHLDAPIQTTTKMIGNLPLDLPLNLLYKDDFYRIPLGYFTGWVVPKSKEFPYGFDLDKVQKVPRLHFSFWMPSLRYPEVSATSYPNLRTCENGRPLPTNNQYIAIIRIENVEEDGNGVPITPLERYEREARWRDMGTYVFSEVAGLIKYDSAKTPNRFSDLYRHKENTDPQIYMECSKLEMKVPNPTCHARFYYEKENLYFHMIFPPDKLEEWPKIVATMRKMLDGWRVADPKEIEALRNRPTDKVN
jgi:hypothetical protein